MLKNQKVFEHILGTPETEDRVVLDKGLTELAQIALDSDPTGKWIVASAEDGDGGKYANFVRLPDGSWQQISTYSDEVVAITPGTAEEDVLYLTSLKDAPRGKILELSAKTPVLPEAKTIIPEGTASIVHDGPRVRFPPGAGDEGPSLCDDHRRGTEPFAGVRPQRQAASGSTAPTSLRSFRSSAAGAETLAIQVSGFLTPPAYLTYQPGPNAQPEATALSQPASEIVSGYVVDRSFATSKDGTKDSHEHHPSAWFCDGWNCSNPRLWLRRVRDQPIAGICWQYLLDDLAATGLHAGYHQHSRRCGVW